MDVLSPTVFEKPSVWELVYVIDSDSLKLNVDFKRYTILGACNPPFAYKALLAEDKIGTMLPCNVLVIEQGENLIEVAAVNPIASMQAISNPALGEVAQQVTNLLQKVIENLDGTL